MPHYNDLKALDLCLTALVDQSLENDAYEIIVSDNMSPVGYEAVQSVIAGRARLVSAPERGAGPARNVGASAASGRILAFTDCDCIPDRNWLLAGIKALQAHDFVGGGMRVSLDPGRALTGAEAFELIFAFDNKSYIERKGFTVTANLFCYKEVFDRVGPFKVDVSEDLEWCQRARALGYRLGYADMAIVSHPARADWPALVSKWKRLQAESLALARANRAGKALWLLRAWALPASILVHIPRILRSPLVLGPANRRRAIATLVRLRLWRFVDAHRRILRRD